MAVRPIVCFLIIAAALAGCQQDNAGTSDGPAEVPQPGPAHEDPGPAPEGQWEPDAEADGPVQPQPASDASAADDAEGETRTGAPDVQQGAVQDADATSQVWAETPETSSKQAVQLKLQSWDQTSKLIAAHKGKVVVVDFWATSCLPCRREFPHLVALQKTYPDTVACVSVSLDYSGRKSRPPQTYREPVLEFLKAQQATIDNVLSTDDPDELGQRLELAPIPLVWVYDREGKLRRTFDNGDLEGEEFTYEKDVVPFVESLLSES
jgi:thiol-disulfide isomerase/thioredoxin